MGGWSNTARQGTWRDLGRDGRATPRHRGWTSADVAVLVVAFVIRWELGLALLALKLWHQASGYDGSVFSFARMKWNALVALTRAVLDGGAMPFSLNFGPKSSGNLAFDAWRRGELERIEAERRKLQDAERQFTSYRDDLLQARDREAFDRFMQTRSHS
jgi:hypothetical protein